MTARTHRVAVARGALHVVDVGPLAGPPVVLLHGRQVPGAARRQLLALPPAPAVTTARPVRFVHGAADRISSPANLTAALRRFPRADHLLYPDVGHAPQWEAADRFNRDLAAFVGAARGHAA